MSVPDPDAVQLALESLRKRTAEWRGPCRECKHFRPYLRDEYSKCGHPVEHALGFSAHGGFGTTLPECRSQRAERGRCGPNGKMFEPRANLFSDWWATLKRWVL